MAKLVTGSLAKHLYQQTWPMVLAIAALISVGIVDSYFIGKLGPDPLAAIGFIFPITVALGSLGVGVMVGINSVLARCLGAKRVTDAQDRAVVGVAFALVCGLIISACIVAIQRPLFKALNADPITLDLIEAYFTPFALGYPIMLAAQALNGCLRAQGLALRSSSVLFAVAGVNWILDPLLIGGWGPFPSYGIAGAAYASVAAMVVSALFALFWVQSSELSLKIHQVPWQTWKVAVKEIARIGGPAAISNAINPIGLSLLTGFLAAHDKSAVAAYGVAGRVQTFAVVPLLALSASIGAIVGQNWGAEKYDRVKRAYLYTAGFCIVYGLAIAAVLAFASRPIAEIFTDEAAVIDLMREYLILASWGYAGFGLLIVTNGAFNAVDRSYTAMLMSTFRVAGVMIPVAYFGGKWAATVSGSVRWIYAGELTANIVGGLIALLCARMILWRQD